MIISALLAMFIISLADLLGLSLSIALSYLCFRVYKVGEKDILFLALAWLFLAFALLLEAIHVAMLLASYLVGEIIFLEPFAPQYSHIWLTSSALQVLSFLMIFLFYYQRRRMQFPLVFIPISKTLIDVIIVLILVSLIQLIRKGEADKKVVLGFSFILLSYLSLVLEKIVTTGFFFLMSSLFKLIGLYLIFIVVWKVRV